MDSSSSPKTPTIAAIIGAIIVGLLIVGKPWLVEHLGISQLGMWNRLVLCAVLAVALAVCIVIFRILNKPKTDV
jgi:hypothetical protein